jgi:DNA-binding IclR family transcriptional regulator
MSAPSNPTARVVAVLDFLAGNPLESFSLSDLARRVDMSKSTCRAILTTLCDTGYLVLDADGYHLGPGVAAAGNAMDLRYPTLPAARDEMQRIADELGVGCAILARSGSHIVILGRTGLPDPLAHVIHFGLRTPLVAPLGSALVAWASPAVFERWLQRGVDVARDAGVSVDDVETLRARYRAVVATVRVRGYSVGLETDAELRLQEHLRTLQRERSIHGVDGVMQTFTHDMVRADYSLEQLRPRRSHRVRNIIAPVFDASGSSAVALSVEGFRWELTGAEIADHAAQLLAAVRRIGDRVGARVPEFR